MGACTRLYFSLHYTYTVHTSAVVCGLIAFQSLKIGHFLHQGQFISWLLQYNVRLKSRAITQRVHRVKGICTKTAKHHNHYYYPREHSIFFLHQKSFLPILFFCHNPLPSLIHTPSLPAESRSLSEGHASTSSCFLLRASLLHASWMCLFLCVWEGRDATLATAVY